MPPKLQSPNSDGWPVYGEQIVTRFASTRPVAAGGDGAIKRPFMPSRCMVVRYFFDVLLSVRYLEACRAVVTLRTR
jgi:hypothetical protein